MTPQQFIAKWQGSTLNERQSYQAHFADLCALVGAELDNAHKTLDAAVAKAYGWGDYTPEMPDEEILRRLLALNLQQAVQ